MYKILSNCKITNLFSTAPFKSPCDVPVNVINVLKFLHGFHVQGWTSAQIFSTYWPSLRSIFGLLTMREQHRNWGWMRDTHRCMHNIPMSITSAGPGPVIVCCNWYWGWRVLEPVNSKNCLVFWMFL